MHVKGFNSQAFLEFLCFSLFGELLFYLIKSGKYLSYVTPRMVPYFYFASIVMIIWALTILERLFRPQHKIRSSHCFVLGIPILLLLLPHNPLTTSNLSANNSTGNSFSALASQGLYGMSVSSEQSLSNNSDTSTVASSNIPSEVSLEDTASSTDTLSPAEDTLPTVDASLADTIDTTVTDTASNVSEEQTSSGLTGLDSENKKIIVSNDDFSMWLTELYTYMEKYTEYTIVITGYVYKNTSTYKENEFVPARLMMSCCVADLSPAGITCEYDKAPELEAGSWVTVEGTLQVGQYEYNGQQYKEPQITVTKITPAEEVKDYIYPFY